MSSSSLYIVIGCASNKKKRDTICENNRATTSQTSKGENLIIQLYECVVCLLAYVREG